MPNRRPNLTFADRLQTVPLLFALVPMAAGVVLGWFFEAVSFWSWAAAAAICALTGALSVWRVGLDGLDGRIVQSSLSKIYVGLAVLFFGASIARAHAPREVLPRGERIWIELILDADPRLREGRRGAATEGAVTAWASDSSVRPPSLPSSPVVPATGWIRAREKLLVTIDTLWHHRSGDRIVFRGYVNPIADSSSSYARLMRARGYTGRATISQYSYPRVTATGLRTPGEWARRLQSAATERLGRLGPRIQNADALAVATAMTTGDRSGITPAVRRNYSLTGASHLLAVSGLHVGIMFLIINALLYLLPLIHRHRGHIVKHLVAVVVIWFYAVLTGLSPSATRAAFMFTGAQLALAASLRRGPVNVMCGTAMVMLAARPGLLFDISFQLSFVAVVAIMAWFPPLYRLVASRWRLLNALWATLIVGFTASLGTLPLVSHTFGVFSPVGVVLNPLIISTAYLIIGGSLLWISIPASASAAAGPLFGWLIGGAARLQNHVVELVAAVPGASIEWTMPLWGVAASYAAMTTLTVLWYARQHRPRQQESFMLHR